MRPEEDEEILDAWVLDHGSAVDLHNGWLFVEAVAPDGHDREWWLIDHEVQTPWRVGEPPEHEKIGRLPRPWRHRVGLQCTAITSTTGQQCRNDAPMDGLCPRHAQQRAGRSRS